MTLAMSFQNLQQENGTLLLTKIMDNMAEEIKMIQPLNLKQKSLNQVFVITQMHIFLGQEISNVQMLLQILMLHLKNCAPFTRCVTHINDEHVETAENLDLIMSMYNLIKYSDNYADSYGSLYQFKRD